jgi:hypothetical protein
MIFIISLEYLGGFMNLVGLELSGKVGKSNNFEF